MTELLLSAFALMLIFEGILPLIAPAQWRQLFSTLLQRSDNELRFAGLIMMLIGWLCFMMVT